MDSKLCKKCIHAEDSELHKNSVCEVCFHIEEIGNGSNSHFIEKKGPVDCCKNCEYCKGYSNNFFITQGYYCRASEYFDKDDRRIAMHTIRKNYLTKNTPKWCPLKGK